jgi:hypothetical protein
MSRDWSVSMEGVWIGGFIDHYTHDSELQAITALSLIYILYSSLEHIVFPSRCLVTALSNGDSSACVHAVARWLILLATEVNAPISRHGPQETPRFQKYSTVLRVFVSAGTCLPSRCPETVVVYRIAT